MDTLLHLGLSNAVTATALALVAGVATLVLRRRPALVHAVWLLVLVKLVTPPLLRLPLPWGAEPAAPAAPPPAVEERTVQLIAAPPGDEDDADDPRQFVLIGGGDALDHEGPVEEQAPARTETEPRPNGDRSWLVACGVVWALGSLGWFALAAARVTRFGRLLRLAPPAPTALQERTRRLARRLGLSGCPAVRVVPGRLSPMLWGGWGAPQLLVPSGLLGQVRDDQLDTILLHELAHLRRRDHWVRALEFAALGLYWWHPAAWWARRELREAEEQCCDAWVVSVLDGARRSYAEALVETLDFLSQAAPVPPPLASGIGHVSDLKRRLTMILSGTTPRALGWRGGLTVLGLGALLPLLPAWVRAEPPPAEKKVYEYRVVLNQGEEAQAGPDAEKARAEAAKLEAELRRKLDEVRELEQRLREAQARAHKVAPLPGAGQGVRVETNPATGHQRVLILRTHEEGEGKGGAAPAKGTLYELVPGEKGTLILRPVTGAAAKEEPMKWKFELADPKIVKPLPPVPPTPAAPPAPVKPAVPGTAPFADGRSKDLEKRLDELTMQLDMLRKELKTRPRSIELEVKPPTKLDPTPKPKPEEQLDEARRVLELKLRQAELEDLVRALQKKAEIEAERARSLADQAEKKK